MSDKFFFKGRKDPRQSYIKYGDHQKVKAKVGSQKYPLALVVTSEARKLEVEALVAQAGLYANVSIDQSEGAVETITTLTTLMNKASTVKVVKSLQRNDACSCGSGKKFKKCCANSSAAN